MGLWDHGKVTIGSRSASFRHEFDDLVDHVDTAFMGLAIVTYDHFVPYGDYVYGAFGERIDRDLILPLSTKAEVESDLRIGTFAGGYRLDVSPGTTVDVMLGLYYSQDEGAKGTPKFDQFHARVDGLTIGVGWQFPGAK